MAHFTRTATQEYSSVFTQRWSKKHWSAVASIGYLEEYPVRSILRRRVSPEHIEQPCHSYDLVTAPVWKTTNTALETEITRESARNARRANIRWSTSLNAQQNQQGCARRICGKSRWKLRGCWVIYLHSPTSLPWRGRLRGLRILRRRSYDDDRK